MHLTHNEMIKTLPDICKHLELEEERLAAEKPRAEVHLAETSSKGGKPKRRDMKRFVNERRVEPCPHPEAAEVQGWPVKEAQERLE